MQHFDLRAGSGRRLAASAQIAEIWAVLRPLLTSRRFILAAAAVLIIASGFTGLDLAYRYAELNSIKLPPQFSLSEDGSLSEWFEYAMTSMTALVMALHWHRTKAPAYLLAACAFVYVTADNYIELHETAGALLAPFIPIPEGPGVRPEDVGELIFFAIAGSAFCAGLAWSLWRDRSWKSLPAYLVLACIPLAAVFGVAIDFIHSAIRWESVLVSQAGAFVEDFGEMMSLCLAFALAFGMKHEA